MHLFVFEILMSTVAGDKDVRYVAINQLIKTFWSTLSIENRNWRGVLYIWEWWVDKSTHRKEIYPPFLPFSRLFGAQKCDCSVLCLACALVMEGILCGWKLYFILIFVSILIIHISLPASFRIDIYSLGPSPVWCNIHNQSGRSLTLLVLGSNIWVPFVTFPQLFTLAYDKEF